MHSREFVQEYRAILGQPNMCCAFIFKEISTLMNVKSESGRTGSFLSLTPAVSSLPVQLGVPALCPWLWGWWGARAQPW